MTDRTNVHGTTGPPHRTRSNEERTTMMRQKLRSLRVLGGAIITAVLATSILAAPASAAPIPDPSETANLHVIKSGDPVTGPGDGTELDTPPGNLIQGVEFTVKQVTGIDLTTQDGWTAASALADTYNGAAPGTIEEAEDVIEGEGYILDDGLSQTTDENGAADFAGLPLGLYIVEETAVPTGVIGSAPFLVTLPLTDPVTTDQWNYDVYVYPKNSVTTIDKTIADGDAVGLGDEVVFTVTTDIPDAASDSDTLTEYVLTDDLDPGLDYQASVLELSNGTPIPATAYAIAPEGASPGGPTITVTFNNDGLELLAANSTAEVVWTITTAANTTGVFDNTASLATSVSERETEVESPVVQTRWGGVSVVKQNDVEQPLAGAVFQVYVTSSALLEPDLDADTPVSIDGVTEWVTDEDGVTIINGLRHSDWANDEEQADTYDGSDDSTVNQSYHYYWLVETVAPTGYELQAQPIGFEVTGPAATAAPYDITVTDQPHNAGFILPFTGGSGEAWLGYAALALFILAAAIAAVILWRRTRRRAPQ